ncbi:hypothetical protein [Nonomuraea sp. NPDC050643]|uniref:hypothetical protein n=1 Tax=Nonomuraea sp. NPDC050643 TaxID=3155660 RepID=UPI00340B229F
MSGGFGEGPEISHSDLCGTGTGLGETGATWLEAVAALRAHLETDADPWGGEAGSMVQAGYLAVTRKALEVYEALGERQVTSGDDVHVMRANYRDVEQRTADDADQVRRIIERM